jgi:hypothetical protein
MLFISILDNYVALLRAIICKFPVECRISVHHEIHKLMQSLQKQPAIPSEHATFALGAGF